MRGPSADETEATRENGTVFCKRLHKLGLLPRIVYRAYVLGVSAVCHGTSYLCGSFDSHTSRRERGCDFCAP